MVNTLLETEYGSMPARRRPKRFRRIRRGVFWLTMVLVLLTSISYVRALTYPGNASFADRSVGWVRDHGGGGLVNAVENFLFTRNPPGDVPPATGTIPVAGSNAGSATTVALPQLPGPKALPGELIWMPGRTGTNGLPALYRTFFQPDAAHASVVAAVAFIPAGATDAHLVPGTKEPGGGPWTGNAAVTPADISRLVATFNSGWKMQDITGGEFVQGKTVRALQPGQASLVISSTGSVDIGAWGTDVGMHSDTVAVRQNLAPIVVNGAPVLGLDVNNNNDFGSSKNQLQYTWRSALGVDSRGDLIYVAGNNMTLSTVASALADAGAVRGMQLDIHSGKAFFASFNPSENAGLPTKLLPDMPRRADRFLAPDQREFLYLTLN